MTQVFFDEAVQTSDSRIGSDGFFHTTGKFARVGVQTYYLPDGSKVRRFRSPKEVKKIADNSKMTVITKDHPKGKDGKPIPVYADNARKLKIGFSSAPVYKDGWLRGEIVLEDADGIKAAQTTHRYFSDGYAAEIVQQPGVFIDVDGYVGKPGAAYLFDEEMVDMEINHRAIVPNPRAGKMAVMDSTETTMPEKYKIQVGDLEQEVDKAFFDAWTAQNAKQIVNDSKPQPPEITVDDINLEVTKRQKAYEAAKLFLGDDVEFDGSKSSIQWMKDALSAANIPFTDENVEHVFAGACHGRHAYQQEVPAVQRFAFQVDHDAKLKAQRANTKVKVQDSKDLDTKARQLLADAQAEEMGRWQTAFKDAVSAGVK